jgi:SAM-dependent methyltransferase
MLDYDKLVKEYEKYHQTPQCQYIDIYSYLNIIGDLQDKSVLDLGCGYGFYTRMFRQKGANLVVGIDYSEEMLKLAQYLEEKNPLGIKYLHADATKLEPIDSFDLVVASFVLNDFFIPQQLEKFAQTSYLNLKAGGRFIALNENVQNPPDTYNICPKYGYTKELVGEWKEGALIKVKYTLDNNNLITFENRYLSRNTYEEVFKKAGFSQVNWYAPQLSPEGKQQYGNEFWQDLIDYQLIVIFEAIKN